MVPRRRAARLVHELLVSRVTTARTFLLVCLLPALVGSSSPGTRLQRDQCGITNTAPVMGVRPEDAQVVAEHCAARAQAAAFPPSLMQKQISDLKKLAAQEEEDTLAGGSAHAADHAVQLTNEKVVSVEAHLPPILSERKAVASLPDTLPLASSANPEHPEHPGLRPETSQDKVHVESLEPSDMSLARPVAALTEVLQPVSAVRRVGLSLQATSQVHMAAARSPSVSSAALAAQATVEQLDSPDRRAGLSLQATAEVRTRLHHGSQPSRSSPQFIQTSETSDRGPMPARSSKFVTLPETSQEDMLVSKAKRSSLGDAAAVEQKQIPKRLDAWQTEVHVHPSLILLPTDRAQVPTPVPTLPTTAPTSVVTTPHCVIMQVLQSLKQSPHHVFALLIVAFAAGLLFCLHHMASEDRSPMLYASDAKNRLGTSLLFGSYAVEEEPKHVGQRDGSSGQSNAGEKDVTDKARGGDAGRARSTPKEERVDRWAERTNWTSM